VVLQWIDHMAGVAYICVRPNLRAFRDVLDAVETLIRHPDWRPGMPIIEDLRELTCATALSTGEEWRAYVEEHRANLRGCRWAVVRRADDSAVASMLETVARDAARYGVLLEQFSRMLDAHIWATPPTGSVGTSESHTDAAPASCHSPRVSHG
jgi:hypothetical protein